MKMNFRKLITSAVAVLMLSAGLTGPALAWDGTPSGKISLFEVTDAAGFGLRVHLSTAGAHCTGGPSWSYLNESDSNYKTYLAVLLLAKALQTNLTLYTTNVGGYCKIGFLVTA